MNWLPGNVFLALWSYLSIFWGIVIRYFGMCCSAGTTTQLKQKGMGRNNAGKAEVVAYLLSGTFFGLRFLAGNGSRGL